MPKHRGGVLTPYGAVPPRALRVTAERGHLLRWNSST